MGNNSTHTQSSITRKILRRGIMLILFQKSTLPSSTIMGRVLFNKRSTNGIRKIIDIVSLFLIELIFIKNMGKVMHTIIVNIQPVTKRVFQLFNNTSRLKREMNFVTSTSNWRPIRRPTVNDLSKGMKAIAVGRDTIVRPKRVPMVI